MLVSVADAVDQVLVLKAALEILDAASSHHNVILLMTDHIENATKLNLELRSELSQVGYNVMTD